MNVLPIPTVIVVSVTSSILTAVFQVGSAELFDAEKEISGVTV